LLEAEKMVAEDLSEPLITYTKGQKEEKKVFYQDNNSPKRSFYL
jgi:hypothetical protein